ncbi:MAG: zinc-binding dehydrogenase [Aigarchaeota archaeon]|nr:zinc-binding dehydrogenase [Aigarchaeota archaeon]MDW8093140.1 zinc-binding dehydrogenase [Nitrososphaerota archaeon]
MRAVVLERQGGPEVLSYREDAPIPVPKSGEALVKIAAVGLNRIDVWIRKGLYKVNLPLILGADISGHVESSSDGGQVGRGDAVVVYPIVTCGSCEPCLVGREDACLKRSMIGLNRDGGYAEFVTVPERCLVRLPGTIDPVEAAAIPINFLTAYHMLICGASLSAGETVLVVGGGSGIGYAAIQLARLIGATVITTVGDDWKVERAYEIGADLVINRKKSDVTEEVKKFTEGKGVDVVFEHAGSDFWNTAIRCLKQTGRLIVGGATTGSNVNVDVRDLYMRRLTVVGSGFGTKADLMRIIDLFVRKRLRVLIDRTYPLKDASKAHARMENSEHFGKILMRP